MATESLIVELKGDTRDLEKSLDDVNKELDHVASATGKADTGLSKFGSVAKTTAIGVTALATAGLAVASALSAMVIAAGKSQQELNLLSAQAKLSIQDFQSLSYATEQYGINAEQIADISKDLADKLGEYGKVGTGAFQDFADVVGLSGEEAKKTAQDFSELSSDQVIGEMVRQMEAAGATGNEMTFVLESMGNDLSRLTPLFKDNNKELDKLRAQYDKATESFKLSNAETEALQQTAQDFSLSMDQMTAAGTKMTAKLAPLLSEFFGGVTDIVPDATQAVIDFINSFLSADDINNIDELNRQIEDSESVMKGLNAETEKWQKAYASVDESVYKSLPGWKALNEEIAEEEARIAELTERKKELEEQEKIADARRFDTGSIDGGDGTTSPVSTGGTGDEMKALEDRFKTEEQLLKEKYEMEVQLAGENKALLLNLEKEYQENLSELKQVEIDKEEELREEAAQRLMSEDELKQQAINDETNRIIESQEYLSELQKERYEQGLIDEQEYQDALEEIREAANDKVVGLNDSYSESNKDKKSSDEAYLDAALSIGNTLAADNEAVQAASIVANTAAGITRQFADLPYPAALATSAAIAVSGAAQLANIGSGSVSESSASTAVDTSSVSDDNIIVSNNDSSGSTQNLVVSFDSSSSDSDVAKLLSNILVVGQQDGVI